MALTVGYDGKFLWRGKSHGSRSGHGEHARKLLEKILNANEEMLFRVYVLDEDHGVSETPRCEVVRLPDYARSSTMRNLLAYPIELRRRPVDVMISYSTLPAYAPCKTVLMLADIFWLANPRWLPRHMAVPRTLSTRYSVHRADHIVTTTEFSRQEIVRILGVPPEKITVVPHGVRTTFSERLSAQRIADVKAKHNIRGEYILSLNDIHPRKNLEGLVEAFDQMKSRTHLPHRLVIAGRALWPYPEFHQRVLRSEFRDDIVMLGYVESDEVLPLYQGASLFMYPSFYEGWGLQVHEAMISGVPVAIADNTTMPEIAGDAADTFDPYNPEDMSFSMERVLTDTRLRDTLIARGYERVKLYSWQNAAEATLAVCTSVAKNERDLHEH